MTLHAHDLIGAARDEVLDDVSDAFLRVHLQECADCRRYEREVSQADRLIAQREASPAMPPLETGRHGERRRWSLIALAASAVIVVAAVGGLALRERSAASQPARATLLGSTLGGISLGASPDDVVRTLGHPDRRSGEGTQWVYERGLWVAFSGRSLGPSSVVVSILAWRGSGAQTEEGFNVHDGARGRFRAVYAGSDLDEQPPLDPAKTERFPPFRVIVVTGRDRDDRTVLLRATFAGEGRAESLELSRARAPGEVRLSGTHVLDPFAVSACELITRAAPRAGYPPADQVNSHRDEPNPLNARLCVYGEDRDYFERHFYWFPTPVSEVAASATVEVHDVALRWLKVFLGGSGAVGEWQADGDGRWIAAVYHEGKGTRYAVGVSVGPYLFIVTERDADAARRLADAVVAELP